LGENVVFIGPNNSGKSSALQALALWDVGIKRWVEKRSWSGSVPEKRTGVAINRRDLIAIPVPSANLLWRDRHVRKGKKRTGGKSRTENVLIEIEVEAIVGGKLERCGLEFDYANEESFYCRPLRSSDGERGTVSPSLAELKVAYLPPMSGLAAREDRLESGTVNVRLGEGRTAEVLRNVCFQTIESYDGAEKWASIVDRMKKLFGVTLNEPKYVRERGEIVMDFETRQKTTLDLSSSGRGQQQTLLLLSHMAVNPGSVLLLDEPDAHLEILRQREIYQVLTEHSRQTGSQIIAASHSEIILNEAADRDIVIAFVGNPHRIDDRGAQLSKSLREIGFDQYYQAEERGWVLYLEGATDLAMLRSFARKLSHPALDLLESPFVHYVSNQPRKAQDHFYALREAKSDLKGVGIFDRLDRTLPKDPNLELVMWNKREFENYFCDTVTLSNYAENLGMRMEGQLFAPSWRIQMEVAIFEISGALNKLGKNPWAEDFKVSDEFLAPVFKTFFESLGIPNLMQKKDYHDLIEFMPVELIDDEIREKLDSIVRIGDIAKVRGSK